MSRVRGSERSCDRATLPLAYSHAPWRSRGFAGLKVTRLNTGLPSCAAC
ncbi:MAG: hypothetical protein OXU61_08590 [Gammaproteobacteria bacterium]|nr:hypothetical protein [Gammaproteobacteria bacterium]